MAGAEAADEVVAGHWQSAVRGSAGVEVGPTCLGRSSPGRAGLRARREGVIGGCERPPAGRRRRRCWREEKSTSRDAVTG